MTQRYIRKYKLTLGMPLSFYEGDLSSKLINETPTQRTVDRARRVAEFERAGIPFTNTTLKDPDVRVYEQFVSNQKDLADRINLSQASGVIIDGLNISFDIHKVGEGATDPHSVISVYNLSNDTVGLLEQRSSNFKPVITLEAGYVDDKELALVFKGEIVYFNDVWEGATRITTLHVQPAPTSVKEAYTVRTYKKDTNVETIIRDVVSDMKLATGVIFVPNENGSEVKIDKNKYIQCQSWEGLQTVCKDYGLRATIEDGVVNVTPQQLSGSSNTTDSVEQFIATRTQTPNSISSTLVKDLNDLRELSAQNKPNFSDFSLSNSLFLNRLGNVFSSNTTQQPVTFNDGLVAPFTARTTSLNIERITAKVFDTSLGNIIGSPVIGEGGVGETMERQSGKPSNLKIKIFLDATIKEQDVVRVKSNRIDAIYRVVGIRHFGEFEGREWYTELILEMLDSYVIQGGSVEEANLAALKQLQERYNAK